ncbi:hypothetical protein [Bacillus sp. CRN 9]|uniref:hypothetical protein n=1 Tax=Cytobacillus horneckiae TaxID=549687 RepID=UPI001562B1D0|nr:hypothetical protein [Bacillus sp. CRN 9]
MYHLALLYLAAVLAGFALANLPTSVLITPGIAEFFTIVGGISIVIFSLALLFLGVKALLKS